MSEIEFTHSTLIYNPPVIFLNFKEGAELDVKEIKEMIEAAETLSDRKPYLLFSDIRNHVEITPEGKKLAADKKASPCVLANAILTNNLALKLSANFFIKINRPHFPLKVFNDYQSALRWLMKYEE